MGGSTNSVKRDLWVCRDYLGVLHAAKVERFFNDVGMLIRFQVATACRPSMENIGIPIGSWHGSTLPAATIGYRQDGDLIQLVEYRIREAPTCVRCMSAATVFDP